ncbi:MAG: hypothetical protein HYV63_12165 [Candidatus Schekmanbacteria bacterium]|nr:hypothetical protein [Candidatus Schekmanbacteria bacterium]
MTKKINMKLFAAAASLASLSVALLAAELVVRIAAPAYDPSTLLRFHYDPVLRITLGPPDTVIRNPSNVADGSVPVAFNHLGFRDSREVGDMGPDDWFALGDSLSFGWGVPVEDGVVARVERLIGSKIYNMSIPGAATEWPRRIRYAIDSGARPRRFLIFHSMGLLAKREPVVPAKTSPFTLSEVKRRLKTHSILYRLIASVVKDHPLWEVKAAAWGLVQAKPHTDRRAAFESCLRTVKSLASTVPETVVVMLPSPELWRGSGEVDELYRDYLLSLKTAGIETVDLRPDFEAGGDPIEYFFTFKNDDGHWNVAGHALAAEVVARYLLNRKAVTGAGL